MKGQLWLLMILDRYGHWTWPKGVLEAGETLRQAAVREVEEETGLRVDAIEELTPVTYWYTRHGTCIHKTVHYYLMRVRGGHLVPQLEEIRDVQWVGIGEVGKKTSYKDAERLVEEAKRILENSGE